MTSPLDLRFETTPEGNQVLYAYIPGTLGMEGHPILGITPDEGLLWLVTGHRDVLESCGLRVDPATGAIQHYVMNPPPKLHSEVTVGTLLEELKLKDQEILRLRTLLTDNDICIDENIEEESQEVCESLYEWIKKIEDFVRANPGAKVLAADLPGKSLIGASVYNPDESAVDYIAIHCKLLLRTKALHFAAGREKFMKQLEDGEILSPRYKDV